MSGGVNIPLLRKAVEWAEAEAAKPPELCEWFQGRWILPVDETALRSMVGKSDDCGTCYCIAGFVAMQVTETRLNAALDDIADIAAEALGIESYWSATSAHLFDHHNTITDVRRIAEDIAGERL